MENTLFAYFENQLFPSPVQPQLRDSLQLFLYDCCIPNNGDTPFIGVSYSENWIPFLRMTVSAIFSIMPSCTLYR